MIVTQICEASAQQLQESLPCEEGLDTADSLSQDRYYRFVAFLVEMVVQNVKDVYFTMGDGKLVAILRI